MTHVVFAFFAPPDGSMGANEPVGIPHVAGMMQLLRLFLNPLVILLLIASVMTAL